MQMYGNFVGFPLRTIVSCLGCNGLILSEESPDTIQVCASFEVCPEWLKTQLDEG